MEHPEYLGQRDLIQIEVIVDVARDWMVRFGFVASARNAQDIVGILKGSSPHTMTAVHDYITSLRSSLMAEFEARLFLPLGAGRVYPGQ